MKLTNKLLLAQKEGRFEIISFDLTTNQRTQAYGNIDIVTLKEEVIKYTMRGEDVLVVPYDSKNSIKICTLLESHLGKRATKKEIIDFINNGYRFKGVNKRFEEIINRGRYIASYMMNEVKEMEDVEVVDNGIINDLFHWHSFTCKTKLGDYTLVVDDGRYNS